MLDYHFKMKKKLKKISKQLFIILFYTLKFLFQQYNIMSKYVFIHSEISFIKFDIKKKLFYFPEKVSNISRDILKKKKIKAEVFFDMLKHK